jgi:hypothetical protein
VLSFVSLPNKLSGFGLATYGVEEEAHTKLSTVGDYIFSKNPAGKVTEDGAPPENES